MRDLRLRCREVDRRGASSLREHEHVKHKEQCCKPPFLPVNIHNIGCGGWRTRGHTATGSSFLRFSRQRGRKILVDSASRVVHTDGSRWIHCRRKATVASCKPTGKAQARTVPWGVFRKTSTVGLDTISFFTTEGRCVTMGEGEGRLSAGSPSASVGGGAGSPSSENSTQK